jgi:secreted protein, putative
MKKRYIVLIAILIIIGVPMLNFYRMKQEINQEMQRVAKSERAKELIEEEIMREDPKAFTEEGIIKSYEIDYNSVKHNPMGGFSVTTYMNNDKELYMRFSFDKYQGYLDIGGGSISGKLSDMLEGQ